MAAPSRFSDLHGPGKRLRVAVLNRIFKPTGGGAERYSIALVEQLAQRHEIHVFAQDIDHQCPGVTYHRVPAPFVRPRWINQLWFAFATWWLTRNGFDVVHSHENTWHGQVQTVHVVPIKYSLLQGRSGLALAIRFLKIFTSPRLLAYLVLESLRYAPKAGRCIALASQSLRATMLEVYPHTAASMVVVTPGIANVFLPAEGQEKVQARTQLGLPTSGRCVLFVGNDYRKKGLPALLIAMRTLPADCYLAVVGNAAQKVRFQNEVRDMGLADRVYFLGALKSVDLAYRAADCLAHPTLEDTFAMVVLEALAHGLPVVVSGGRFCGIADLLAHESNALILADPLDSSALAQSLKRVLDDPVLRVGLQVNGLQFAQRYLWSEIAVAQERIYNSVA
jgi:UDP-glucose:(heptosyl)LPS alpha-1,3-glucosyltransferase